MKVVFNGFNYCKSRVFRSLLKARSNILQQTLRFHHVRKVLGIETSCDDTGAAVVDENGNLLGESLQSQSRLSVE